MTDGITGEESTQDAVAVAVSRGQERVARDEDLARHAAAGDRAAFASLAERYRHMAYACAYAYLRSPEEAEDAVQEALVRAYQALSSGRLPRAWLPWFLCIVRNYCRDRARRRAVREQHSALAITPPSEYVPHCAVMQAERSQAIQRAVEMLPDKLRIIITLHYRFGLTYTEIASVLGIPPSTVTGRIAAAFRMLRRTLTEDDRQ